MTAIARRVVVQGDKLRGDGLGIRQCLSAPDAFLLGDPVGADNPQQLALRSDGHHRGVSRL